MDEEVELGHYGRIFRRRRMLVALSVLSMTLLALVVLPSQTNFYESTVSVRLVPSDGDVGRVNDPISEETEALVAASLGDQIIAASPYEDETLDEWRENIAVSACLNSGGTVVSIVANDCNTQILEFRYRAEDPERATTLVKLSADTYLEARLERARGIRTVTLEQLQRQLDDLDLRIQTEEAILRVENSTAVELSLADIRLRRIEPERLEIRSQINQLTTSPLDVGGILGNVSTPESDSTGLPLPLRLIAGILMGLLLGGSMAVMTDRLDRRVADASEVELDLGAPVLGDIPRITEGNPALVTAVAGNSAGAEAYRRLAAAALAPRNGIVLDSIALTGANDQEGRTSAAANLALAIAQSGRKVLLIGADRRNTMLDQIFGLTNQPGFNDFLTTTGDIDAARIAISHMPTQYGISIMPTGLGKRNPLSNNAIAALLAVAQEQQMTVVFDTPPALTHADGLQIAAVADAVYIVAGLGKTRRSELTELRVQLLNVQADVAGVILNRSSRLRIGNSRSNRPARPPRNSGGASVRPAPFAVDSSDIDSRIDSVYTGAGNEDHPRFLKDNIA